MNMMIAESCIKVKFDNKTFKKVKFFKNTVEKHKFSGLEFIKL